LFLNLSQILKVNSKPAKVAALAGGAGIKQGTNQE